MVSHQPNSGLLNAIGKTPLVPLRRVFGSIEADVFGKLEFLNPGGSLKDRAALNIIKTAIETGELRDGSVVVESSSGNMGIGLAQACLYFGIPFICVVDANTTQTNIALLKAYGAQVEIVREPDPVTHQYLPARLARVKEILHSLPGSYWTNQYGNILNANAHHQTMREIVDCIGQIDYIFCATSTCGTLRGCADFIGQHHLKTKLIAVDAVGSVIFGGEARKRLIPGHGAAVRPALYRAELASACIHISDLECVVWCRRLLRSEALLAGGSSGAIACAFDKLKREIGCGSSCVLLLPDRGERYLDTIYSDDWVSLHFGNTLHLCAEHEAEKCITMTL